MLRTYISGESDHESDEEGPLCVSAPVSAGLPDPRGPAADGRGRGLRRDLELLEALASDEARANGGGLGVVRIAQIVGRDKGQVSRSLRALADDGVVERDPGTLEYRIGWRLFSLVGRTYEQRLFRKAQPLVQHLAVDLEETAHLCVLRDRQVLTLLSLSGHSYRAHDWEGQWVPAACTSSGRALLVDATPDELYVRFGAAPDLEPKRPASRVHTLPELWAELQAVRRRGWAEEHEEFEPGLVGVSAPVRDFRGRVIAAINVSGPVARLGPRTTDAGRATARTAVRLSVQLGWVPPGPKAGPTG
ncbi:IclR family transcriptional regulator [Streptomyces sp. NPDC093970]|uniref:IclR family transcriptional regulator n=1 Tax=Streptomyces sp. NPDC093970 TaxID=3155076 RepID=UPI00342A6FBE